MKMFDNLVMMTRNIKNHVLKKSTHVTDVQIKNMHIRAKEDAAMEIISEAVDLAKEVQMKYPNDYWANYNLALAYLYYWRPIDAWSYAINAINIDENIVHGYELLFNIVGRFYNIRSSEFLDKVINIFNNAIENNPKLDLYREQDFFQRQQSAKLKNMPSILINTMPKSGTIYIRGRLSEGLNMPFCQLTLAPIYNHPIPSWLNSFISGGAIATEHFALDKKTKILFENAGLRNIIIHVRDPREAALSLYHFHNKQSLYSGPIGTVAGDIYRGFTDFQGNYKDSCKYFIPWTMDWIKNWIECANDSNNNFNIKFFTYDQFIESEEKYFKDLMNFFDIDYSLFNKKESISEKHNAHFRKGQRAEWREVASLDTQKYIWSLMDGDVCDYFGWNE